MTGPDTDTYTELAVAIGRLEEGQRHSLDSMSEIKATLSEGFRDIRLDYTHLNDKVDTNTRDIAELKSRSGPRVSIVTWLAGIAAVAALVLSLLNQLYGA